MTLHYFPPGSHGVKSWYVKGQNSVANDTLLCAGSFLFFHVQPGQRETPTLGESESKHKSVEPANQPVTHSPSPAPSTDKPAGPVGRAGRPELNGPISGKQGKDSQLQRARGGNYRVSRGDGIGA